MKPHPLCCTYVDTLCKSTPSLTPLSHGLLASGRKTSGVPWIVGRSQIKGNYIQVTAECRFPYTLFLPFFFSNLFIRSEGNVTIAIHKVPS